MYFHGGPGTDLLIEGFFLEDLTVILKCLRGRNLLIEGLDKVFS